MLPLHHILDILVGRPGLEPGVPCDDGFTVRCDTNSAQRPICGLFIVLSPHFLGHDSKILFNLILIKLSFSSASTPTTTHLTFLGQQHPTNSNTNIFEKTSFFNLMSIYQTQEAFLVSSLFPCITSVTFYKTKKIGHILLKNVINQDFSESYNVVALIRGAQPLGGL